MYIDQVIKVQMIRLAGRITKIKIYQFGSIEQHKPTPIQARVQREGIMAKKMLDHKYKLIKSSPHDSKELVSFNYIELKKKLNNRYYYIPNKKQYLLMIDQAYEDIMKVHEDHGMMEMGKQRGAVTKKQFITYELNRIKRAKIIAMILSYEFACVLLLFLIFIEVFVEQMEASKSERVQVLNQFEFKLKFSELWFKFKKQYLLFLHRIVPQSKLTSAIQTKLRSLGVTIVKQQSSDQKKIVKIVKQKSI